MRCRLFAFTLSMALINYVLGIPQNLHGYNLSEDYSSGEQGRHNILLSGKIEKPKRSLVAGDTFTPQEMLPIAEKLFAKVEEAGAGNGFVSSTKGPKELADKLFEAFFFGTKRIVTLKDQDIIGIDALQALALEGEAADNTDNENEVTEPAQEMYLRGQLVDIRNLKPLKSHYKLVTKLIPEGKQKKVTKAKRRGIPLSKKLPPKRHLVVNERPQQRTRTQKKNGKYNKKKTERAWVINKNMKNSTLSVKMTTKPEKKKANCHWKYVCSSPGNLDTCHVQTSCGNLSSPVKRGHSKSDEKKALDDQFRRMIGITAVDEEVEKILEVRNLKLRPVNLGPIERVESLAEFFNKIIVRENMESTTSFTNNRLIKLTHNLYNTEPDISLRQL